MDRDLQVAAGQWRGPLAGFCALLVGIGLARFAYSPLIPVIIAADWLTPAGAGYVGGANLAGYLAGALLARRLSADRGERWGAVALLRAMMLLAAVSFLACAWPLSFAWLFAWRFAAGLAGGVLMVLAAPLVLPHVAAARRGMASGIMFSGVGLGIMASGTLVPFLLRQGLVETWYGLGALALALTALAWRAWPSGPGPAKPPSTAPHAARHRFLWPAGLAALALAYGLNAMGQVPHMIFLVDFIARGLGRGVAAGADYWLLFGFGAAVGPVLAGVLADRLGFGRAFRLVLAAQAAAVLLPALTGHPIALVASSLVVGAFVPGIVPLALGRARELAPGDPPRQQAAWGLCTTVFAIGQAAATYGISYVVIAGGAAYSSMFFAGAAALVLALVVDAAASSRPAPTRPVPERPGEAP